MTAFEEMVQEMRTAQKMYFKTPKHKITEKNRWLDRSKQLEKQVDEALDRRQNPKLDL